MSPKRWTSTYKVQVRQGLPNHHQGIIVLFSISDAFNINPHFMSQLEPLSEHGNGTSNGVGPAIRTVPNKEEDLQVLKSSVVNSVNHIFPFESQKNLFYFPFESQKQSWTKVSAVWLVLGNWRAHGLCSLPRGQPSDLMESFVRVRSLVPFLKITYGNVS